MHAYFKTIKIIFTFFVFSFFQIYASSKTEIITNVCRSDGFGAQFQSIIYSVIYAEFYNKKYLYTPFRKMEHNYSNDEFFLSKKEWLINFIGNFDVNTDYSIQQPVINQIHCEFFENNLDLCASSNSLQRIKEIFWANKNKNEWLDNENFHIAMHIRRPNSHDSRIDGADIPDEIYLRILQDLRSSFASKNSFFHIYSQGDINTFKDKFGAHDVVFHINEPIEETFISMVAADVLVTSASSFSYVAGFLSEGIVYYMPFWHPPLSNWIVLDR